MSQGGKGGNGGGGYGGGSGGHGGSGGDLYLGEDGRQIYMTTSGDNSNGVYMHSQGRDGGNGQSGSAGDGGDGGVGGTAGLIETFLLTGINTSGGHSPAFTAYSTGGAGGSSGSGGWLDGKGGTAGNAANGGIITLDHWGGYLNTKGPGSEGLVAQSIGGHAGSASGCTGFIVCFGANGGSAGDGGKVTVTNSAAVTTEADESVALMVQSLGGGGGNGGTALGGFYAKGGKGGAGGAGGSVEVSNTAALTTWGNDATGIYAQSIGGSGGDGGDSVGMYSFGGNGGSTSAGGTVTVTNSGVINAGDAGLAPSGAPLAGTDPTCGAGCSHGIFAQSVGGGGGNAGSSVAVFSVGGSGGGGGTGGTTKVTNIGNVTTHLDQSKGILAQSVGGGGGAGGGAVAVSAGLAVAIGGSGGDGGDGNTVTVNSTGAAIRTAGSASHAISAQSVGGGGGHGGFAVSLAVGADDVPAGSIAVGGTGGDGGSAGVVEVNVPDPSSTSGAASSFVTTGEGSHGIVAQSIGGGGGDGGFSIAVEAGTSMASGAFSIGGKGSKAGNGEAVTLSSNAAVTTTGDNSNGLYAQSIGGGGGNGGFSAAGAIDFGGSGAVALAFGGTAGGGGTAENTGIVNSGTVTTTGSTSHAIVAQSVAGGGGNGGLTLSGTFTPDDDSYGAALSFGASGGDGGSVIQDGELTVKNTGALTTSGNMSSGIIAQSIGGGGGNGSMSLSGTIAGPNGMTASVSHGGSGGSGGSAYTVSVTNTAAISTGNMQDPGDGDDTVNNAHGILAQSIGGGGGNGGLAGAIAVGAGGTENTYNVAVAVGGTGGSGGNAGSVTVKNNLVSGGGALTTFSEQSYGIFAQAIGGGGGNGGSAISGTIEVGSSMEASTVNSSISVGGSGGDGNQGGDVTVYSYNPINTWGDSSHGIFAQSVGGGGGAGGSAKTLTYNLKCVDSSGDGTACESDDDTDGTNYNVNIGVGGSGGTGNHGGEVSLQSEGDIYTQGDGATAIYAQSIGGGGGDGGDASAINTGDLAKKNRTKNTDTVTLYVGGSGSVGGDGGTVTLAPISGTIKTEGANAPGVYAQSIGGGGGKGGTGITSSSSKSTFVFGGSGKSAGDGGNVILGLGNLNITTGVAPTGDTTDTSTMPDSSYGIFAQSVGGGGGAAGNPCLARKCSSGSTEETIAVGVARSFFENGGGAGDGGFVVVQPATTGTTTNITTYADNAMGILAQSVGGGGGTAGSTQITLPEGVNAGSIWGSVGGDGIGGTVTVDHVGTITTYGDGATGIFAQSAGGDASGGNDVTVTVDGSVIVSGTDANGILAQSVKLDSSGNTIGAGSSVVTVNAGSVVQGGYNGTVQIGAGVEIRNGVDNYVYNYGKISTLGEGPAIMAPDGATVITSETGLAAAPESNPGRTTVINEGLVDGDIVLGGRGSTIRNRPGGRINTASLTGISAGGKLLNDGEISIYGDRIFGKTRLDAQLAQSGTGTIMYDLAHPLTSAESPRSDALELTSEAVLAGTIDMNVRDAGIGGLGRKSIMLIETDGELNADAIAVIPSAVAQYRLEREIGSLELSYDIDFLNASVRKGLSGNQTEIAAHLSALHDAGRITEDLLYLTEARDTASYGADLNALSPAPYGVNASATQMSSLHFGDSLMSCKERSGEYRFIREGDCLRLDVGGRRYSRDSSSENDGYDLDWGGVSIGMQKGLRDGWIVGLGLAYEDLNGSSDGDLWSNDGDQFRLGVAVKRQLGASLFAASLSGGFGSIDVDRNVAPGVRAKGDQDVRFVAGQLRAAHVIEHGDWYVKPRVDLNMTYVDTDDVSESGAGAASLVVQGIDETYVALRPAIEFGGEFDAASGDLVRPRVLLGLTHYLSDPSQEVTARMRDAVSDGPAFTVENDMDKTSFDFGIGVDILSDRGIQLSIGGIAQISKNATSYGGDVRLAIPF